MAYNWKADLHRVEAKYGIPQGLLGALVRGESGGRANAMSPVGAIGLTQLMPSTAKSLGVNPHDPRQNLEGGAKYLAQQLKRFKSVPLALAAYNAGPGAVQKYGGVPPYSETKQYVQRLTKYWKESGGYQRTNGGLGTPQNAVQGPQTASPKRIPGVPVPNALPQPKLKQVAGLEDQDMQQLNDAYRGHPEMAQAIAGARQREQDHWNSKYNQQLTAYQANQQQRQAALNAQNLQLQQPNQYPNRIVAGDPITLGGKFTPYDPNSKFVKTPNGWVRNYSGNEQMYQYLQRLGQRGFGLRNDPGDYQTTGGNHVSGSNHYSGHAVDFGDARNSRDQLFQFANWARQNASHIRELYYNPLGWGIKNGKIIKGLSVAGHDDHLHIAE